MSTRTRMIFWVLAWLIVLMPFLFWRSTWFGRPLSENDISEYLRDESKPRHMQHALVQVGERIARGDAGARQWYPELVRLASHRVEEIRTTDAWVMGQDPSYAAFREPLHQMLSDSSPLVRSNAALALVRFGDDAGRAQILEMLKPTTVTSPRSGRVADVAKAGDPIRSGTMLARLEVGEESVEVRAPITGRIHSITVAEGAEVREGAEIAVIDPGTEQVWEALRGLYLIGRAEDIAAIQPFQRETPSYPARIAEQARATEKAIRGRDKRDK